MREQHPMNFRPLRLVGSLHHQCMLLTCLDHILEPQHSMKVSQMPKHGFCSGWVRCIFCCTHWGLANLPDCSQMTVYLMACSCSARLFALAGTYHGNMGISRCIA